MRRLIEKARAQVAALVDADVDGVIFTSGATEAAHLALTPNIKSDGVPRPAGTLYVLATEHPCVLAGGRFEAENIKTIPVLSDGMIDMDTLDRLLDENRDAVPYIAIGLVNSETGIVQPVADIARRARFKGGYTLCDAVQAVGRMPVSVKDLGVDFLIVSGHKIGGPQGVGALIIGRTILEPEPVLRGGGQEKNRRGGTENVAAIAGFGAAANEAAQEALDYGKITALRDLIEAALDPICAAHGLSDRLIIFGAESNRVGNTLSFAIEGLKAETALIAFDLEGVAVSSGSACSSGKVGRSHVLEAMGVDPDLALGAIRVSLGWNSTRADADKFIVAFERIAKGFGETLNMRISGAA